MRLKISLLALLMCVVGSSFAERTMDFSDALLLEVPPRPEPFRYINDYGGFFSDSTKALLEQRLSAYADTAHISVVVVSARALKEDNALFFSLRLQDCWNLKDSCATIIYGARPKFINKDNLRIDLSDDLNSYDILDMRTKGVRDSLMMPLIRRGELDRSLVVGVDAVLTMLSGERPEGGVTLSDELLMIFGLIIIWGLISLFIALYRYNKETQKGEIEGESKFMRTWRTNIWLIWLRAFLLFVALWFIYLRIFRILYTISGGRFRDLLAKVLSIYEKKK